MQIGRPLRTIIVEPLENPIPATAPDVDAEPCAPEPKPVAPADAPEPEKEPATP